MNNMIPFPTPPRAAQPGQTNPMQMIRDQFMRGMTPTAILERMAGPQANQARQIISGKNPNQLREIAMNMAKQRGVDLSSLAQQMGVKIPD